MLIDWTIAFRAMESRVEAHNQEEATKKAIAKQKADNPHA